MPRPTKRITFTDVAQRAGVGTASVDRVIHDRGNVSEGVRRRVLEAARELGLNRMLPDAHRRQIRIEVILARPGLPLIARLGYEFRRIAPFLDRSISIHRTILEDEQPETLANALSKSTSDAVVSYLPDHPLVHQAVDRLSKRCVPVVTVVSDVPGSTRLAYAGTDHVQAGRSAAYFITTMTREPGPTVILCNHLNFQSHADRIRGFSEYPEQRAAGWSITGVIEGLDDRDRSELALRKVFKECPDIAAVYNVGAANIGGARHQS
ncbi:LacI family DNA-binding transcriptional regulator [Shinella sp. S4-D37]|uniref:LacI family DNA-binding transcriptional regulator n=1 Tax=Shinella sp. S4-D37 TaxID=3161999 RepID=UPI003466CA99